MKKMILLGAAAIMMAFSASAQMSLVKDLAKKAASGNPQALMEVLQNIEPAFTNPEITDEESVRDAFVEGQTETPVTDEHVVHCW